MQIYFTNLGCKLNQAEVDQMSRRLLAAGHALAPQLSAADLHVINSCSVTHLAARDSRKIARRGHRLHPGLRTVLTGCYATSDPEEAAALAGVDLVVTNERKDLIVDEIHQAFPEAVPAAANEGLPIPYVPLDFGHARALVKIEDGCNMGCSFCIIPRTRGKQRSRSVDEVVAEVQALSDGGYREVVITGVQISEYDHDGSRLYDLVRRVLAETDVPRLRLTSIAPWKFDDRLLELWSDRRLCRHIHMSLQSGCTTTLRRMRRPYSAEAYAALVDKLRTAIDGLAVTTDVIIGFPGEDEREFAESLAFVEQMQFAKPHMFTYSTREQTHAATLPGHVDPRVKKERMAAMQEAARASERRYWQQNLGQTLDVVWEERRGDRWSGLTGNYIRVFAESGQDLEGTLGTAELLEIGDHGVSARVGGGAPALRQAPSGLTVVSVGS